VWSTGVRWFSMHSIYRYYRRPPSNVAVLTALFDFNTHLRTFMRAVLFLFFVLCCRALKISEAFKRAIGEWVGCYCCGFGPQPTKYPAGRQLMWRVSSVTMTFWWQPSPVWLATDGLPDMCSLYTGSQFVFRFCISLFEAFGSYNFIF
jgi:hypothetical protein